MQGEGVGAWIRRRRRQLGLTQVDLADRIGVSQQYVSLLENGEQDRSSFPVPTACSIAYALDVDPRQLVDAGLHVNGERLARYLEVRSARLLPPYARNVEHARARG